MLKIRMKAYAQILGILLIISNLSLYYTKSFSLILPFTIYLAVLAIICEMLIIHIYMGGFDRMQPVVRSVGVDRVLHVLVIVLWAILTSRVITEGIKSLDDYDSRRGSGIWLFAALIAVNVYRTEYMGDNYFFNRSRYIEYENIVKARKTIIKSGFLIEYEKVRYRIYLTNGTTRTVTLIRRFIRSGYEQLLDEKFKIINR